MGSMAKTFYTSDPHFGHLLVAQDRGFTDSASHDAALAEAWCSTVGPDDTVWVLGDLCVGSWAKKAETVIAGLPGIKHLVLGNHDVGHPIHRGWLGKQSHYLSVFATVHTDAVVRIAGRKVRLNHFPYTGDHVRSDGQSEDRYTEWRPRDAGGWLIHGHVHDAWQVNGRQINVGADVWGLAPVEQSQLERIIVDAEQGAGQVSA